MFDSAPDRPNSVDAGRQLEQQVTGCRQLESLCVYCGSRGGNDPAYLDAAREVGVMLARQGRRIVYGGGHVGMMGMLADSALAEGGRVVGVIPAALQDRELGHRGLTEMHVVETMHQRKAMMAEKSDAFMALPGGMGTYEEILEAATWAQLGIQDKPLGILNVRGFFDPLLAQLDRAVEEGFMLAEERALIVDAARAEDLVRRLEEYCRPGPVKWMDESEM